MNTNIFSKAKIMNGNLSGRRAEKKGWRALRRNKTILTFIYTCALALTTLLLWHAAVKLFNIPKFLVPDPVEVAKAFQGNVPLILKETGTTTFEILAGFGLSVIVGIPLALAIFLSPTFSKLVYPGLIASQAVPKVAVAPLLVVWFGYGLFPKVFIAFLIAFFPIVINTVTGLAATEQEKLVLARSMGFGPVSTFFKIRLPSAAPNIFSGLKIAITLAVVGAIVGEFVGGNAGLGYQLMVANGSMDTALLFALLITLTLLGVILFVIAEMVERLLVPAHRLVGSDAERR